MKRLILCICTLLIQAQSYGSVSSIHSRNGLLDNFTRGIRLSGNRLLDTLKLADPTIFLDDDTYYLYGTSSNNGFLVYQSKDLVHWGKPAGKNNGLALTKGESYGTKGFWAPQVFKHNGRYYMIYTANEQLAIASADHPLGPFKQKEIKHLSASGKQIDPFVYFDPNGKVYLYHVRLQEGNRIFVSEMKPDLSDFASSEATECIAAVAPWENTANASWPVSEGPTVFKDGKTYYMLYSANDFRNPDYAVGYATATSPLGPWKKYAGNSILHKEMFGRNGTGHGDLLKDKGGKWQYVFHAHKSNQQAEPRVTAIVPVIFNGDQTTRSSFTIQHKDFKFLEGETVRN